MNYWDTRKTKAPVMKYTESEACCMSLDFFPGGKEIVFTSLEGDVSILSVNENLRRVRHINLQQNVDSNVVYSSLTCKDNDAENGNFFVG